VEKKGQWQEWLAWQALTVTRHIMWFIIMYNLGALCGLAAVPNHSISFDFIYAQMTERETHNLLITSYFADNDDGDDNDDDVCFTRDIIRKILGRHRGPGHRLWSHPSSLHPLLLPPHPLLLPLCLLVLLLLPISLSLFASWTGLLDLHYPLTTSGLIDCYRVVLLGDTHHISWSGAIMWVVCLGIRRCMGICLEIFAPGP